MDGKEGATKSAPSPSQRDVLVPGADGEPAAAAVTTDPHALNSRSPWYRVQSLLDSTAASGLVSNDRRTLIQDYLKRLETWFLPLSSSASTRFTHGQADDGECGRAPQAETPESAVSTPLWERTSFMPSSALLRAKGAHLLRPLPLSPEHKALCHKGLIWLFGEGQGDEEGVWNTASLDDEGLNVDLAEEELWSSLGVASAGRSGEHAQGGNDEGSNRARADSSSDALSASWSAPERAESAASHSLSASSSSLTPPAPLTPNDLKAHSLSNHRLNTSFPRTSLFLGIFSPAFLMSILAHYKVLSTLAERGYPPETLQVLVDTRDPFQHHLRITSSLLFASDIHPPIKQGRAFLGDLYMRRIPSFGLSNLRAYQLVCRLESAVSSSSSSDVDGDGHGDAWTTLGESRPRHFGAGRNGSQRGDDGGLGLRDVKVWFEKEVAGAMKRRKSDSGGGLGGKWRAWSFGGGLRSEAGGEGGGRDGAGGEGSEPYIEVFMIDWMQMQNPLAKWDEALSSSSQAEAGSANVDPDTAGAGRGMAPSLQTQTRADGNGQGKADYNLRLPGQDYPGLRCGKLVNRMLCDLADKGSKCDMLTNVPSCWHNALFYSREPSRQYRFLSPAFQAYFDWTLLQLAPAVSTHGLAFVAHAWANGHVKRVFRRPSSSRSPSAEGVITVTEPWAAEEQVYASSDRIRNLLWGPAYRAMYDRFLRAYKEDGGARWYDLPHQRAGSLGPSAAAAGGFDDARWTASLEIDTEGSREIWAVSSVLRHKIRESEAHGKEEEKGSVER